MTSHEIMDAPFASRAAQARPATVPLNAFVHFQTKPAPSGRGRLLSMVIAGGVQVLFIAAMIYGTMHEFAPKPENITVVNVVEEVQQLEEQPRPPPPKFETPVIHFQPPLVTITEPPPPNAPTAVVTEAPPPPPPAIVRGNGTDAVRDFQMALLRHLNHHKRYPPSARAKREQGVVYVRFAMDRRGRVLRAEIERHSKYRPLDEEGLALLRRAEPLPVPPIELAGDPLEMVVPVEFSLRRR